jgi:hypothetical protein
MNKNYSTPSAFGCRGELAFGSELPRVVREVVTGRASVPASRWSKAYTPTGDQLTKPIDSAKKNCNWTPSPFAVISSACVRGKEIPPARGDARPPIASPLRKNTCCTSVHESLETHPRARGEDIGYGG